jgi:hypothetical protein
MKIKHAAIAVAITSASLSLYAVGAIEWRTDQSRPSHDAWINTYKPVKAEERLKGPVFPPTDKSMFLAQVYPSDLPANPAQPPGTPVTEQQLRKQVNEISGQAGLRIMDDRTLQAKTQDIRLLASLATTVGSISGGTADAVKSDVYSKVAFGRLPAGGVAAQVVGDGSGRFKIIVNENYQHEDIRLLGILLGHEALHQDASLSVREELIAHAFEILAYAQQVIKDPTLASQGTVLTCFLNTVAMGLLNTRSPDGLVHLLEGRDEDIWPASSSPVDFLAQNFVEAGLGLDTAGNDALLYSMRKLTGNKELKEANFDDEALALLDENINALLAPEDWIALAKALKLDTVTRVVR